MSLDSFLWRNIRRNKEIGLKNFVINITRTKREKYNNIIIFFFLYNKKNKYIFSTRCNIKRNRCVFLAIYCTFFPSLSLRVEFSWRCDRHRCLFYLVARLTFIIIIYMVSWENTLTVTINSDSLFIFFYYPIFFWLLYNVYNMHIGKGIRFTYVKYSLTYTYIWWISIKMKAGSSFIWHCDTTTSLLNYF